MSDDADPFKNYDIEEPNDPDFVWPPIRPRTSSLSSDVTICIGDEMNSPKNGNTTTSTIEPLLPQPIESCQKQTCEVIGCNEEVFSTCVRCLILQCWDHFLNDVSCEHHLQRQVQSPSILIDKDCGEPSQMLVLQAIDDASQKISFAETSQIPVPDDFEVNDIPQKKFCAEPSQILVPEAFEVDGAPKEAEVTKKDKKDKKKQNKQMKDLGKEYTTQVKKAIMPERKLGPSCNKEYCQKMNRKCYELTEEFRQ